MDGTIHIDHELFAGGPPHRLKRSLGLIRPGKPGIVRRALLAVVLGWVLLVVLAAQDLALWGNRTISLLLTVQDVQMLSTTLHAIDNLRLTVPNAKITDGVIPNYAVMPTRRISLTVGVSYGDDLHQVKRVLADVLAEDPLILKELAPCLGVSTLGERHVYFAVQVWGQRSAVRRVRVDLPEKIKLAFDQHGITLP